MSFNKSKERCNSTISSDATITFNKKIATLVEIEPAIFLATLIWKRKYFIDHKIIKEEEKSFFNTQEDMQQGSLLPPHKQTKAINILKHYQLIDVEKKGCPARNHFTINYEIIDLILSVPTEYFNDQSLRRLFSRKKASYSLVIKRLNDYINTLNETSSKETSSKEKVSSKEETSKADALPSTSNKTILHKRSNGKLLMNAKLKVDKPLKAKKPIKPYQPTEQALDLIEYWEGKGLKSISHKPETQIYERSLIAFDKLLSGKAFNNTEYKSYEGKKFTLAEIRKAISRFALMALNSDYEPRNVKFKSDLSKISPADFIFNAYVSSNGYGRSKFIHCHENEAKIIREKDVYVEDKYPNVTKAIMNKYKKDILGGSEIQFTNDDLNAFRKAANFAYELFAKNKNRLLGTYAQLKPYQIAESMFEALERGGADFAKVKPHWLCNSAMQKQLPAYLYQAAILQDRTCEGQQQVHYYDFGRPFSG